MNVAREARYRFPQLEAEDELRAERIHNESIVIDMLFQGPLSPRAIPEEMERRVQDLCAPYLDDPMKYVAMSSKLVTELGISGDIPQFKEEWYASGITAGNRQLEVRSLEDVVSSMGEVQRQFDNADWLTKALTAEDVRRAKRENRKAGIVTAQETFGLGKNLDLLDALHDFGLRVLQLTYNTQNYVGAGCAEVSNAGISNFGIQFIERLNDLHILVDTGHCGKQTTLDACRYSNQPVIASHTAAESIYPHMRCKSDEEIQAIAKTGGVIGVFAMPTFIYKDANQTTIDHVLDHIDYVVGLVGPDHVGIGTDWPMSDTLGSLIYLKEKVAPKLGFRPGDGPSTEMVAGFETYGHFANFTRGLVARGYSDDAVQKMIGGNWLRVFEEVCG